MATSRIRLYNIPDLAEEKKNIMEGLGDFLKNYRTAQLDIGNFQWQRLELSKTIKINATQLLNTPLPSFMFNYCRIDTETSATEVDTTHGPAFYFVEGVEQEAKSTIKIYLKLDVLNTFYDQWKDKMTNGTYIVRGHEDRFTAFDLGDLLQTAQLVHKFNRVSEGDNFPMYEKESERITIYQTTKGDTSSQPLKFYLIYRTAEDGRPCMDLAASRQLTIGAESQGQGDYTMLPQDFVDGRKYYLLGDFQFSVWYMEDLPPIPTEQGPYSASNGILQFWYDSNTGDINAAFADGDRAFTVSGDVKIVIQKGRKIYFSATATMDRNQIERFSYIPIEAGDYSKKYLGAIDQLDKTDARIVKVVECPYCPVSYTYNSTTDIYTFPTEYFPDESELESPRFLRTYNVGKELPKIQIGSFNWNPYLAQACPKASITGLESNPKVAAFLTDPKIFTSSYFSINLVYDSFAKQIKLEDYQHTGQNYYGDAGLQLRYKQSANVSSALLFEAIPQSDIDPEGNFILNRSDENYPRIMTASRNNEVALFSSEYLTYLKNGYNYDKKKMETNLAQQGITTALQALGSFLSFALAPATGGFSAAAGVSLAAGAATSAVNLGFSAAKSADEMNQKINLLKAQSYAVSSIDDLDLFNDYGKNKLQILRYSLNENDKNNIENRFQYYGYAVGKYANPYPFYFNGRHNFNYLKCDPVFRLNALTSIPLEYLDEIADKLRNGITIWHSRFYLLNGYNNYALNKDYENIEESVLDTLRGQSE